VNPVVSVLLPVRDAQATLGACLGSLAVQTLADHEVVAVDDGSSDRTPAILAATAAADPRVRVVRTPARGVVAALNTAIAHARGTLIARMDADDVCRPERLALQALRLQEDARCAILGSRVKLVGARGANRGMRDYVRWLNGLLTHADIVRDLLVESPIAHPSVMVRAEVLRDLDGYREFDGPEDYDLWLRAHARGWRFGKREEVLLEWRDHPGRLTRRDPRYSPERFRALKLEALEHGALRGGRGVVVWGAGPVGKAWARALRRRGHGVAAFVEVDPRKIGQRIHGTRVVDVAGAAAFASELHLAAVGRPGARARIRAAARRLGLGDERLVAVA
jgi:glycosyltransferase involved in cell wall biosynthesis